MGETTRIFTGIILITLGFLLVIFGVLHYTLSHISEIKNGNVVVVVPPFVIINGSIDPALIFVLLLIILLIPFMIFIYLLRIASKAL